ncbi:MAG: nickel pincer cofactor biosynthesis protein LarC [Lachnospiraceae bacterium]|nr:nickel pincer cofactor biosynthesis protein LarC [Lachnospiraceae bacterium]
MRTLYLDCGMGAAGDMLTAALLELCPDREAAVAKLNQLGIPGVTYQAEMTEKCGITGTHMHVFVHGEEEESHDVMAEDMGTHGQVHCYKHGHEHEHSHEYEHDHNDGHSQGHDHNHEHSHEHEHDHNHSHEHDHTHHHHSSMQDIRQIIDSLNASEKVKKDALAVYQLIAEAESKVHGKKVEEIHFHEVGTIDAVADVAGVCFLMEELKIGAVYASPVHVGSGHVHCAHGILPVPAPATALLLQGIPIYSGNIRGELCTPTGAAILKHFVKQFGPMPVMTVEQIGYGMGKKDFEAANCVRALLSQEQNEQTQDAVVELRCNLDDMSGEELGYAAELLLREGALDVYTAGVSMKKSRPGVLFVCLCREADVERMEQIIFRHTTTLGIRKVTCQRTILTRRQENVETAWGTVRKKVSELPGMEGMCREKLEYEDLAAIADKTGLSIPEIRRRILKENM